MINALVYTAEIMAMFLSGFSSDYLRKKEWLSNTNIRKLFETIGKKTLEQLTAFGVYLL